MPAFLDDHVFMIFANLELYDATLEAEFLDQALELQATTDTLFWDTVNGGYFFSPTDGEELLVRQKEIYDGAIPSGNSVAAMNLLRLARLTGRTDLADRADTIFKVFAADSARGASAHSHLADAMLFASSPSLEIDTPSSRTVEQCGPAGVLPGTSRSGSSPSPKVGLTFRGAASAPGTVGTK